MMTVYDDVVIPAAAGRQDRDYPEYALSTPRLKVRGARVLARAEAMQYLPEPLAEGVRERAQSVLTRLIEEGRNPVYDELVKLHGLDPVAARDWRVVRLWFINTLSLAKERVSYVPMG